MQRHAEDIRVGANVPGFVRIEVHIAGDWLRIWRRWIERMGQHAAWPVKWKRIRVRTACEKNVHSAGRRRARALPPSNLNDLRPLRHRALDLRLSGIGRHSRTHRAEYITNGGRCVGRAAPTRSIYRDVLPDGA